MSIEATIGKTPEHYIAGLKYFLRDMICTMKKNIINDKSYSIYMYQHKYLMDQIVARS